MSDLDNAIEIEQIIISTILYDNSVYSEFLTLNVDDFSTDIHKIIYEQMQESLNKGNPIDPIIIKSKLPKLGEDGWEYLIEISTKCKTDKTLMGSYLPAIKEHSLKRKFKALGEMIVHTISDPNSNQTTDIVISNIERELLNILHSSSLSQNDQTIESGVQACHDHAIHLKQNGKTLYGVTSGIKTVDDYLLGFNNSNLIILAARPGMGKTALALNFGYNASKAYSNNEPGGAPVLFFSCEMSYQELSWRIIANEIKININEVLKGNITSKELYEVEQFRDRCLNIPFYIDESSHTLSQICSQARHYKRTKNIGMIVIDYLQLLSTGKYKGEARVQELTEITRTLKSLAKELDIPIIALSQLSRAVELRTVKKPTLADLRESGSIEQDADIVMFIYREAYYLDLAKPSMDNLTAYASWYTQMEREKNKAELIISKFRRGRVGSLTLGYEGVRYLFTDPIV